MSDTPFDADLSWGLVFAHAGMTATLNTALVHARIQISKANIPALLGGASQVVPQPPGVAYLSSVPPPRQSNVQIELTEDKKGDAPDAPLPPPPPPPPAPAPPRRRSPQRRTHTMREPVVVRHVPHESLDTILSRRVPVEEVVPTGPRLRPKGGVEVEPKQVRARGSDNLNRNSTLMYLASIREGMTQEQVDEEEKFANYTEEEHLAQVERDHAAGMAESLRRQAAALERADRWGPSDAARQRIQAAAQRDTDRQEELARAARRERKVMMESTWRQAALRLEQKARREREEKQQQVARMERRLNLLRPCTSFIADACAMGAASQMNAIDMSPEVRWFAMQPLLSATIHTMLLYPAGGHSLFNFMVQFGSAATSTGTLMNPTVLPHLG